MELNISTDSMSNIENTLLALSDSARIASRSAGRSQLSTAFSQIPGLGFLAAEHGRTLAGNPGSAVDEFNALEQRLLGPLTTCTIWQMLFMSKMNFFQAA